MKLLKNIIRFLEERYIKPKDSRDINESIKKLNVDNKTNFINSLDINKGKQANKSKIRTPMCLGDGLGIQTQIKY